MVDLDAAAAAVLKIMVSYCARLNFFSRDDVRDGPGTTSNGLVAGLAVPDSDSLALDGVLSAEGAGVTGVLGDFHLLHLLTQGSTVSVGTVSAGVLCCVVRVFVIPQSCS